MTRHEFGGSWTREKLEILRKYSSFFTTALKDTPFTLHYVDAFAGTGEQGTRLDAGQGLLMPEEELEGSAKIALNLDVPFHRYHFNDQNPDHVKKLEQIKDQYSNISIDITQREANEFIKDFCRSMSQRDRALLFVDPYSTEFHWETLEHVAETGKIDLWLLFPISALLRMTPKSGLVAEWKPKLDKLLGTDEWQEALYRPVNKGYTEDLFGEPLQEDDYERLNHEEVGDFIQERLKRLFPYVSDPAPLRASRGAPLFLFFFAVSNKRDAARRLARRVVNHILKSPESSER